MLGSHSIMPVTNISLQSVLESGDAPWKSAATHAPAREGKLPLTGQMLLQQPSGNLFGLSMDVAMGWSPDRLLQPEILLLSTQGGLRADDGTPVALGFHTGHWEVGLLVAEAARELADRKSTRLNSSHIPLY